MARSPKSRILVDANVLVAGAGWPRFPFAVLNHVMVGHCQLVLTARIIQEAQDSLAKVAPEYLPRLHRILEASRYETVDTPTDEEIAVHLDLVRDQRDIHVALAAIAAQVDCLVSQDRDFTDPGEPIHQHVLVLFPGTFLREYMGWTSEQLEAIRHRTWGELEAGE